MQADTEGLENNFCGIITSMKFEGEFNIRPENQYHGDPSLPNFRYNESEKEEIRAELKKEGMNPDDIEAEIVAREIAITIRWQRVHNRGREEILIFALGFTILFPTGPLAPIGRAHHLQ